MKYIFSIGVFGNNPRYIYGAYKQYELAQRYYPGWEFRVYIDDASRINLPGATVIEVKDNSDGTFWRFFPWFESGLNVTICRDADSRITAREAMATYEWLASDKMFHVMRDHPSHRPIPILAGMCGMKGQLDAAVGAKLLARMLGRKEYGADQDFLANVVYPVVKHSCMEHEFDTGWFGISRRHLYNRYEWVGNGFDENELPIYPPNSEERDGYDRFKLPESAKFCGYFK